MLKFHIGSERRSVGRFEVLSNAHNGLPNVELFGRVRLPMLHRVCGVKHGAVDLGKIGPPEVKSIDSIASMLVAFDKARCDSSRC